MERRPSPEAIAAYREVLLDRDLQQRREAFCRSVSKSLDAIAGWLAIDSWLGGGDQPLAERGTDFQASAERLRSFGATAVVVEMASELAAVAVLSLDNGRRYAAAAVIRQVVEAEYLLAVFGNDFEVGSQWATSDPAAIRKRFSPAAMRKIGGFSNEEYWRHCDYGGHPSPAGRNLLRFGLPRAAEDEEFFTASLWGDLAQHLRRLWHRADELLTDQHARYVAVRAVDRQRVTDAEQTWVDRDPLASPIDFSVIEAMLAENEHRGM